MAVFPVPTRVRSVCQGGDDNIPDEDMPGLDVDDAIVSTPGQNVTVVDGQIASENFD